MPKAPDCGLEGFEIDSRLSNVSFDLKVVVFGALCDGGCRRPVSEVEHHWRS
jgi:hypothetical protein